MPMLPLRGMIVFPGMIINLDVGRERSIKAVEAATNGTGKIFLLTQKSAEVADPNANDLYTHGLVAEIKQLLKLPNGAMRVLVEGLSRAEVISIEDIAGLNFMANIKITADINDGSNEIEALKRMLVETFEQWVVASKKINTEVLLTFKDQPDCGRIADMIAGYLSIDIKEKEKVLEAVDVKERLKLLYGYLCKELEIVTIEKNISQQVRKQIEQNQREYYLREQM
jgi:ATP-dependent Lon protease